MEDVMCHLVPLYLNDLKDMLKIRLLNSRCKYIIDTLFICYNSKKISKNLYSRRTMFYIGECWNCHIKCDNSQMHEFTYIQDTHPKRKIITCKYWKCVISALHYYIYESLNEEIMLIDTNAIKPISELKFLIPRTNPSIITHANINKFHSYFIYWEKDCGFLLQFYWFQKEKHQFYIKNVPVNIIQQYNPDIDLSSIQNIKPIWIYGDLFKNMGF